MLHLEQLQLRNRAEQSIGKLDREKRSGAEHSRADFDRVKMEQSRAELDGAKMERSRAEILEKDFLPSSGEKNQFVIECQYV